VSASEATSPRISRAPPDLMPGSLHTLCVGATALYGAANILCGRELFCGRLYFPAFFLFFCPKAVENPPRVLLGVLVNPHREGTASPLLS
jgi:hypothetical protein